MVRDMQLSIIPSTSASSSCAESGETYYPAGRRYAALALELLRGLERPRAEDEELMRRIELLFN